MKTFPCGTGRQLRQLNVSSWLLHQQKQQVTVNMALSEIVAVVLIIAKAENMCAVIAKINNCASFILLS